MPLPHVSTGDLITSSGWNNLIDFVNDFEINKVNKAGDDMTGPLTVDGNVGIGTTSPQSELHLSGDLTTNWELTCNHFEPTMTGNETRPWLKKAWNGNLGDFLTLSSTGNRSNEVQSSMILAENGIFFGRGHNDADQLSTEWMRIGTNGSVGIGVTTPTTPLDVSGIVSCNSIRLKPSATDLNTMQISTGALGGFLLPGAELNNLKLSLGFHSPFSIPGQPAPQPPTYAFHVGHTHGLSGFITKFSVSHTGAVRIPNLNQVNGSGQLRNVRWGTGNSTLVTDGSSKRYKKNITPLADDFKKALQLQPCSFNWKNDDEHTEIGLIAEDVDALGLKHLVFYDEEGRPDGVDYEKICLYLLEVVKKHEDLLQQSFSIRNAEMPVPNQADTKAEMRAWLSARNVNFDKSDTKAILLEKIKNHQ